MDRPIVVSSLFTAGRFDVYPAPIKGSCFFFTNRPDIADRAHERGWEPIMMPLPRSDDPLTLSLQSKAIKFLAFVDDPIYSQVIKNCENGILYFDHKLPIESHHVTNLMDCAEDKAIVIRSTPKPKNSIWTELEGAMRQERYARHMPDTKIYIEKMLEQGTSADTRICNTGLIYYSDPQAAMPLAKSVLQSCLLQAQPECQIFWAAHAQRYSNIIKVIEWDDPAVADIAKKDPKRALRKNKPAPPPKPLSKSARVTIKLRNFLNRTNSR